ncbi:hypothetical protein BTM25_28540 [Actinomadura rubteroloni]|uniref:Protein kinase domain-containing protein n=1 Tax=Actinomadura rubteroloni TaxID=1926885 RepID=A0A2P4UGP3_9ACTN|nr:molecular chaperone DnaJ [Actinomadura rubteroloni]POM24227.1 hypothetical protein BTM25_28540 [Actinomadura rubteroloni]
MTVPEALRLLDRARDPRAVFGADEAEAARVYRRLARVLHPDAPGGGDRHGFVRLGDLWRSYHGEVLTTPKRTYRLGPLAARGDLCALYEAGDVLLKMPRDPSDSDLLEREAAALRRLARGERKYRAYVPRLVESFRHRDAATGADRRVNALARLDGFVTLADVRAAYPGGLDARDVAWMWRRLLVGLGFAHRTGVVHGAVLPEHVLIHPADHGVVLVDWCYSTTDGGRIPALVARYADRYPPEVTGKRPATPATDIYLATHCMTELMGDAAPDALVRFARGCALPAPTARPDDAWRLLGELDEILERLYGPRRFRPFTMP